jgi:hypothetical protein
MRRIWLGVLVLALSIPGGGPSEAQFSSCQYCWTASGDTGICLDVVTPSPSLSTLSECQGIQQCFPFLGGAFCRPACTGHQCYWV